MMRIVDQLLALMSKEGTNGCALCNTSLSFDRVVDGFCSKAVDCMVLEIGSQRFVFGILETPNATSLHFALESGVREKMCEMAIVVLNRNIWLEKTVDWQVPSFLQEF